MKIVPYRVKFEVDIDSANGKYRYSKPTSDMLEAEFDEIRQAYKIKTHDRGNNAEPGPYYQVAFRIEDPSPYSYADLELRLDSTVYRNSNGQIKNDLYCDPKLKKTADNLWYQQSRYEFDKKEQQWKIVGDTKKKSLPVECITTSGVFKPIVIRNGKILDNVDLPWIYVLPSSVSVQDYQDMLSDLIKLHDSLVRNDSSTVGTGRLVAVEADTERMRKDTKISQELEKAIRAIIASPSELQGKEYVRMPLRKIHHYDSRVIRDYIRHGMSGKTLGINYFEDHDTYENRVIKHMLKRIQDSYRYQKKRTVISSDDIETKVNSEYKKRTAIIEPNIVNQTKKFKFDVKYRDILPIFISVNGNCVSLDKKDAATDSPFSISSKYKYIKLFLKAKSRHELLFYLEHLANTFTQKKETFSISCTVQDKKSIQTKSGNTIYTLTICDITRINCDDFSSNSPDMSEKDYENKLFSISSQNKYISLDNPHFVICQNNPIGIQEEEEKKIKQEIRSTLLRKNENSIQFNELFDVTSRLIALLDDPWFVGISDIRELNEIRPTAKFRMNKNYLTVYNHLTEMMENHAILASDFDINAFGIIKTECVYEYWVFYRLLYQLMSIGFSIDKDKKGYTNLIDSYRNFIHGRTAKASGFSVETVRKLHDSNGKDTAIHIEVGYEKQFATNSLLRKPDYYLCITSEKNKRWYFMDAKYKCFSKAGSGKVSYLQEIYDVSLSKYIADMKQIFETSDKFHSDEICGSYIIMADVDDIRTQLDDFSSPLSDNNRLFGGPESILSSDKIKKWDKRICTDLIDDNSYDQKKSLPCHRYGAIHLTPNHTDELQSLLELIFEYTETKKDDNHPYLAYCWKCGNSELVIREKKETRSSNAKFRHYKYYVTCPKCSSFRVDNHCITCGKAIIKHTHGNFHIFDRSVANPQWAFICPSCGSPVNGFPMSDEELDEMSQDAFLTSSKLNGYLPVEDEELPF